VNPELLRGIVTVAFGALAGGLTNTIAIWMLFHPYSPPLLFGRWRLNWLQGAVPKNQVRLAAAIGRTVGNRLLTEEDLTRILSTPEFRAAFDERLAGFLDEALERERGSIRELLPPEVAPQVESFLALLVDHGMERLDGWLASDEFEQAVAERTERIVASVADRQIGELLTPAREAAVAEAVDDWLSGIVSSDDFQEAVEDYLERASERLLEPDRTFEEVLPLGLVSSLEKAIQSYLPIAIERLGQLLEDDEAREKFQSTIRELFHRFLGDLKFHQRMVARLVVTEDTLDKVLDTIEKEGADRLSELLTEESVQEAMARNVNEAIVEFLRRPVRSVLGEPGSDSVHEARETLAGWLVGMARDPQTRSFLVEKLQEGLEKAGGRSWGDVLENVPTSRVTGWLVDIGRSRAASRGARDVGEWVVEAVMEKPVGRPARWLPNDASSRIEGGVGPIIWSWLQGQVPDVVRKLDVAQRVETKVIEFPTPKLEELVRKVTDRELRLIVQLGYLLGAVIGLALVGLNALIG